MSVVVSLPALRISGDYLLIASIDELSSEDRRHVAALVESLRKKSSEEQNDS